MTYKIDFPVSNHLIESERTLNAYIDLVDKYKDSLNTLYFPLGYIYEDVNLWGIRAPSYIYDNNQKLSKDNVLKWENGVRELFDYVKIPAKILMNNIYSSAFSDKKSMEVIAKKLNFYANRYYVDSVVVSDTQLIPFIKSLGLNVCLSTNSHNSLTELDMVFQLYGADAIKYFVLQRDHNRQASKLNSYLTKRNIQEKLILMVNEGCINACPFKTTGDIEISLDQVKNKVYKIHNVGCEALDKAMPWSFLTSQFLSKSMIEQYYPNAKIIKISGRDKNVSQMKYFLKHWVDGENLELSKILNVNGGKTIFISELDNHKTYTKDVMSCNKECFVCNKCSAVYEEIGNELK